MENNIIVILICLWVEVVIVFNVMTVRMQSGGVKADRQQVCSLTHFSYILMGKIVLHCGLDLNIYNIHACISRTAT